jgi:hypothetical protein
MNSARMECGRVLAGLGKADSYVAILNVKGVIYPPFL